MKWKILAAIVGIVAVSAFCASAQTAYSVNVVGFQKIALGSNDLELGGNPFAPADPDIQEVIGDQLTAKLTADAADNLYLWDIGAQNYKRLWLDKSLDPDQWRVFGGAVSTDEIPDGAAFFLQSHRLINQEQIVVGDVVEDGAVTNWLAVGLTMLAYPFSADVAIQDLTFENGRAKLTADAADNIYIWREQNYKRLWLDKSLDPDQWRVFGGGVSTDVLYSGEGFFYQNRRTNAVTWTQARPYTL
jgi:hypothetical protein